MNPEDIRFELMKILMLQNREGTYAYQPMIELVDLLTRYITTGEKR